MAQCVCKGPSYNGPFQDQHRRSRPLYEAFDTVETEQDRAMMDVSEGAIQQETELD